MKSVYLDYAATTPLDPRVKEAMEPYWSTEFGNPSSLYPLGKHGKEAIEKARKTVAETLNARPEEIYFTGGGTEAINLALFGIARNKKAGHIITSTIEHDAVLESVKKLEKEGFSTTFISVLQNGIVDPDEIGRSLTPETILVSIMYANNEIGTIQPIKNIAKIIKDYKRKLSRKELDPPYFFTDACQAVGTLNSDIEKLGVDLLAFNGSKIYGPKGIGALYVKKGISLEPLIYGGGQEKGLRSGTENVPAIVGLASVLELKQKEKSEESKRLLKLRDFFFDEIRKKIPEVVINGDRENRLPNNINISFPGVEGDALVIYLGEKGISASTGSACSSTDLEPSHVLRAIKCPENLLRGSLRLTLGKETTKEDLEYVLEILPELLKTLQKK